MASDASAVLKRVKDEKVEFVRFWFTDIFGQLKSFAIGKDELDHASRTGWASTARRSPASTGVEESDVIAMPDPDTVRILPWRGRAVPGRARLLRRARERPGGRPRGRSPLRHAPGPGPRPRTRGFDHYYLGPELEFFLFRDDQGTEVLDRGGYFDLTTLDVASDFRRDAVFTLRPTSASRSSTRTTRSAPRSTRSTCASPTA